MVDSSNKMMAIECDLMNEVDKTATESPVKRSDNVLNRDDSMRKKKY